ncbi:hypothetical protein HMPREF1141_2784 [Clostridium sp. MSTE9]|uniref:hypothetical protein n=1 Tax=Clostridium sp. (strain MSTE9) TaxID=1105031 RepID=UPI00026F2114|nr:hypothetical protein [Clostridium sp. MSTE9]EJF39908.1 hypothetical protein HMPREF1141_2784 [Clostridium sp. MSTE9]
MKNKKLYLIAEDTYYKHIAEEVHLYGLLHQLAFLASKVKDPEDMEHLKDTALRYGQIAEELFEGWNIPGRYLVYGDKADLHHLKDIELVEVEQENYMEDDDEEELSLRDALEDYRQQLLEEAEILAEAVAELDALDGE